MSEVETREITQDDLKRIKPYTGRRKTSLWGQPRETVPTIVHTVFGDGGSLITLDPTNSRPDYYIMLADSSITCFEDALVFISHNEELVFQTIEEEYGNEDDPQCDDDGYEIEDNGDGPSWEDGEMPLNIGSGYTAGYYDNFEVKNKES